tara:strand:- start:1163 stop:2140 length:978 start_codon:yes stop_codon:yes gene_type:complete
MESTTLEQAAESLLSTSPENTGGEDNLSEAVDEITEPTEDVQGEEIEATDEYEDDIDASDDEYDDAEIDDDLVDVEAQDTNLIPVKVDGKDENWTLDQLKQSAAGQAAINKRFQEVAQARKQVEQQAETLAQQRQQILQVHQQMQQGAIHQPTPPSRELFDQDPIGYMEEKLKYDEDRATYDNSMQQMQAMQQQQQQAQQAHSHAYLQEQAEILKQRIPELADPEKGAAWQSAVAKTGTDYGFSEAEMQNVMDSRQILVLNDARKWRALQASKGKAQQKGQNARPVVRAGAKKRQDGTGATRKKAQTRLQKTGSIDDAVNLIFDS